MGGGTRLIRNLDMQKKIKVSGMILSNFAKKVGVPPMQSISCVTFIVLIIMRQCRVYELNVAAEKCDHYTVFISKYF